MNKGTHKAKSEPAAESRQTPPQNYSPHYNIYLYPSWLTQPDLRACSSSQVTTHLAGFRYDVRSRLCLKLVQVTTHLAGFRYKRQRHERRHLVQVTTHLAGFRYTTFTVPSGKGVQVTTHLAGFRYGNYRKNRNHYV